MDKKEKKQSIRGVYLSDGFTTKRYAVQVLKEKLSEILIEINNYNKHKKNKTKVLSFC